MTSIQLRDYQQRAVDDIRAAYARGRRAPCLVLPTGGGKSAIASYVAGSAAEKGRKALILVHRKELLLQFSATLDKFGIKHGLISSGYTWMPYPVQVASVQTLVKRLDRLRWTPDLITVDECIAGESLVQTDRGLIPIKSIKADGVKALCQFNGKLCFRTITRAWKSGSRHTIRFLLSNGKELVCTPNHKVYLGGRWTEARNLKAGDLLASPAVFASADAVSLSRETVEEEKEFLSQDISFVGLQGLTGTRSFKKSLQTHLYVSAGACNQLSLASATQPSFGQPTTGVIPSFCLGMTSDRKDTASSSQNLSVQRFSAPFLATAVSDFRTVDRQTQELTGLTADHKPHGFTTKALFFGDLIRLSSSPKTTATVISVFACTPLACPALLTYGTLLRQKARNESPKNGLTRLATLDWLGGTATTGTWEKPLTSIPRVIPKKKTSSSPTGLEVLTFNTTKKDVHLFGCASQSRESLSKELVPTSQNQCDTSWVRIERVEEGPTVDVYDLTVEEAHNFFANGVLVHNCHHAPVGAWRKILEYWPKARSLGVTATPCRTDGTGLGEVFDELVLGPSVAELTERGYLSLTRIYAPPIKADLTGVRMRMGDYAKDQISQAMDKPSITGDAVEHYRKICPGAPAIAFCTSIEHAQNVAEAFRSAGFSSESLDGTVDPATRERLISDLGNGRLNVLTSCEIISEGTDIPVVVAAILLRPTQSLSLALQQMGRVLRPAPGKDAAIILDHVGNVAQHGLPEMDREWSLEGQQKRSKKKADPLPVRTCPECFCAHKPQPVCPSCGHRYAVQAREIEQVSGELVEIDKAALIRQRKAEQAQAKTLEELIELGRKKGYKPGWARNVWAARQSKQQQLGARHG